MATPQQQPCRVAMRSGRVLFPHPILPYLDIDLKYNDLGIE